MQNTIDVSKYIQELHNRSNVQVRSLEQVENTIKNLFATGQRKAVLLFHSQVHEALIRIPDDRHIEVADDTLPIYMKPGDMVIVVLPTTEGKRYVLQTTLEELFVDRFILQILDPRATERQKFAGHKMLLWQVPTVLMLKLEQEQLHLVRVDGEQHLYAPKQRGWPEKLFQAGYNVIDFLRDIDLDQVSLTYQALIDSEPISAKLLNISLGGLCLRTKAGMGKQLKNYFLYVDLELVGVQKKGSKLLPQPGIKIMALTVVRGLNTSEKGDDLHLMFLSSLPDNAASFFPNTFANEF